jgi:hypothetical protein
VENVERFLTDPGRPRERRDDSGNDGSRSRHAPDVDALLPIRFSHEIGS